LLCFQCSEPSAGAGYVVRQTAGDLRIVYEPKILVTISIHCQTYFSIQKVKAKGSLYSTAEHRVLELIMVLGSQPADDVSHKPGGRLPLLSANASQTKHTETDLESIFYPLQGGKMNTSILVN